MSMEEIESHQLEEDQMIAEFIEIQEIHDIINQVPLEQPDQVDLTFFNSVLAELEDNEKEYILTLSDEEKLKIQAGLLETMTTVMDSVTKSMNDLYESIKRVKAQIALDSTFRENLLEAGYAVFEMTMDGRQAPVVLANKSEEKEISFVSGLAWINSDLMPSGRYVFYPPKI